MSATSRPNSKSGLEMAEERRMGPGSIVASVLTSIVVSIVAAIGGMIGAAYFKKDVSARARRAD